jgi:hypothetical protein
MYDAIGQMMGAEKREEPHKHFNPAQQQGSRAQKVGLNRRGRKKYTSASILRRRNKPDRDD